MSMEFLESKQKLVTELIQNSLQNQYKTHYRGKTRYVVPTEARSRLKNYQQCILGFSLQNIKFENPKLKSIIGWINKRFEKCAVLIGDSIHRITVQINQGLNEEQSIEEAKRIAAETIERARPLLEDETNSCKFEIVLCSEIQKLPEYFIYHNQLCELFEHDEKFKKSVLGFADIFLSRKEKVTGDNIKLSCSYLLEEMAILECLTRRGYPVFVYPGSMATLTETSGGEHPDAPEGLKSLVIIALDIKGK